MPIMPLCLIDVNDLSGEGLWFVSEQSRGRVLSYVYRKKILWLLPAGHPTRSILLMQCNSIADRCHHAARVERMQYFACPSAQHRGATRDNFLPVLACKIHPPISHAYPNPRDRSVGGWVKLRHQASQRIRLEPSRPKREDNDHADKNRDGD
jgi:hypothetical protein